LYRAEQSQQRACGSSFIRYEDWWINISKSDPGGYEKRHPGQLLGELLVKDYQMGTDSR